MATPEEPTCDACLNGWEDLNPWDGVDYCDCCEMWLCGVCYAYLHGQFTADLDHVVIP